MMDREKDKNEMMEILAKDITQIRKMMIRMDDDITQIRMASVESRDKTSFANPVPEDAKLDDTTTIRQFPEVLLFTDLARKVTQVDGRMQPRHLRPRPPKFDSVADGWNSSQSNLTHFCFSCLQMDRAYCLTS